MRRSRLDAARLQNLEPMAWSALLNLSLELQGVRVTAVEAQPVGRRHHLSRYVLTLDGCSDPITLVGKESNSIEARFYRDLAEQLGPLTARCWFSEIDDDDGWIVIDDVPNDYPTERWAQADVEAIIREMAYLHATYWNREAYLDSFTWLPRYLGQQPADNLLVSGVERPYPRQHGDGGLVSGHALRSAGRLAPRLLQAANALARLRDLGGWPDVLGEPHLSAVADLLDDPVPMLEPLRSLPVTLLHGDPSIYHWHLTLFGECRLLDWYRPAIGPSVCDLICFVEQFDLIQESAGIWRPRRDDERPVTEQTLIDSYLLQMSAQLGEAFSARDLRRALPAARCLYVVTVWFPLFAAWYSQLPNGRQVWSMITNMSDDQLAQTDYAGIVSIKPYLANVFRQFLQAYRSL